MERHSKILVKDEAALLVIDVQERILPVMRNSNILLENILKLVKGCKVLGLPIYYTEQYPKGLGSTADELKEELLEAKYYIKSSFSCFGAGSLFTDLKNKGIKKVIVCGIESHVCVQQTVLDFLANGFCVALAADAVSSRKKINFNLAIKKMQQEGADITSVESILFELLVNCGTEEFKSISRIVK